MKLLFVLFVKGLKQIFCSLWGLETTVALIEEQRNHAIVLTGQNGKIEEQLVFKKGRKFEAIEDHRGVDSDLTVYLEDCRGVN